MRLAVLFSGGKDSGLALYKNISNVVCLISIISENSESYMFHVPNIGLTKLQAEAIGIPLIEKKTKGEKEKELKDLKDVLASTKKKFKIDGIVTGAIRSNYQKDRIQKICDELNLKCINPLWHRNQIEILNEIVDNKFKVVISGVFAFPLEKELLGKIIDKDIIKKLKEMEEKYQINPSGEGGEIETTILDAPFFKKKIEISDYDISYKNYSGVYKIKKAKLVNKKS